MPSLLASSQLRIELPDGIVFYRGWMRCHGDNINLLIRAGFGQAYLTNTQKHQQDKSITSKTKAPAGQKHQHDKSTSATKADTDMHRSRMCHAKHSGQRRNRRPMRSPRSLERHTRQYVNGDQHDENHERTVIDDGSGNGQQ